MTNRTRQIIVVATVFVIALASLGTVIGLLVNTGQMSEYSDGFRYELKGTKATITSYEGSDTDVVVPDKLKGHKVVSIAKDAFAGTAVKSIKFNCKYSSFTIAGEAFNELTGLEKVVLPSNLKEIPYGAFNKCTSLESVIMPSSLTKIGDSAFKECTALKFIYYSENYSTEGDNAIRNNVIYLPTSLLELGSSAFEGCTAITSVNIYKDLEKIGDKAFSGCSNLNNLRVDSESEINSIGDEAFSKTILNSSTGTPLYFPNLVNIGAKAFSEVKTNFTYMKLPSSVTSIGANAFSECTSLNRLEMAEDMKLESMGEGVFQGCYNLRGVTLPTEIKEIPAKTFMGCYNFLLDKNAEPFEIGKYVESIGDGAFAFYTGLPSNYDIADYSRNVISVNSENEHFTVIRLEDSKREDNESSTYRQGLITDKAETTVYAYFGAYESKSFSPSTNGKTFRFYDVNGRALQGITTIKPYAFAGVRFSQIEIPSSIEEIGEYAFFDSQIVYCYTDAINWTLTDRSFSKVEAKDADIEVVLTLSNEDAEKFRYSLNNDYNVRASFGNVPD